MRSTHREMRCSVLAYWKFESISLQQRVVQTSFHVTRPRAPFGSRLFARARARHVGDRNGSAFSENRLSPPALSRALERRMLPNLDKGGS